MPPTKARPPFLRPAALALVLAALLCLSACGGARQETLAISAGDATAALENVAYEDQLLTGDIVLTLPAMDAAPGTDEKAALVEQYQPTIAYGEVELPLPVPGSGGEWQEGQPFVLTLRFEVGLGNTPPAAGQPVRISLPGFEEAFVIYPV